MEALGERIEPQSCAALQIGEWRVAPDLNQISRGQEVVHLEPKAMAVLLHLASRPGEVASRDELLATVWPGVIVGDNALTQVVIKLRKALGDTAREPTYIQAISKKGYRLIAVVDRLNGEEFDRPQIRPAAPPAPRRRAARWVGATLAVAVLAAGATWYLQREGDNDALQRAPDFRSESSRLASLPTVIVKPLEAVGDDSQQALIARAITSDLVTDLSKVSGLWVASGLEQPDQLPQGAEKTRARYLLSGTVQRDGERLRLQVHLADVVAGQTVVAALRS